MLEHHFSCISYSLINHVTCTIIKSKFKSIFRYSILLLLTLIKTYKTLSLSFKIIDYWFLWDNDKDFVNVKNINSYKIGQIIWNECLGSYKLNTFIGIYISFLLCIKNDTILGYSLWVCECVVSVLLKALEYI